VPLGRSEHACLRHRDVVGGGHRLGHGGIDFSDFTQVGANSALLERHAPDRLRVRDEDVPSMLSRRNHRHAIGLLEALREAGNHIGLAVAIGVAQESNVSGLLLGQEDISILQDKQFPRMLQFLGEQGDREPIGRRGLARVAVDHFRRVPDCLVSVGLREVRGAHLEPFSGLLVGRDRLPILRMGAGQDQS
jgi:hypothetical protein